MTTANPKVERGIKGCRGKWGSMRWCYLHLLRMVFQN